LAQTIAKLIEGIGEAEAMIALYDPTGRILFANPSYRRAFFLDPVETPDWPTLMRRNHALRRGPVVSHDDFETWLSSSLSRRGKVPMLSIETDMHDGSWLHIVEQTLPDGYILFTALDITRLRQSERMLRLERDIALKTACTDPLTGISNRAHILQYLDDCVVAKQNDAGAPTSVVILDIDHFKQINDRFGHLRGDDVLRAFARTIRAGLRTCDAFGRIGGEEFLILFPGYASDRAEHAITRIREDMRNRSLIAEHPAYRVDFSAGLTEVGGGDTVTSVCARADHALYAAKSAGRGRLRLAN